MNETYIFKRKEIKEVYNFNPSIATLEWEIGEIQNEVWKSTILHPHLSHLKR